MGSHKGFKRNLITMTISTTFWSEYIINFCEPDKCILNYIISIGYVHEDFHRKSFEYDQFNNHFSIDMDKTLIGLKSLSVHRGLNINTESRTLMYMSETKFIRINNELNEILQSDIDLFLSQTKERFILKRGIIIYKEGNYLIINIQKNDESCLSFRFTAHQGFKFCKLKLIRVKNNEYEGFRPIEDNFLI